MNAFRRSTSASALALGLALGAWAQTSAGESTGGAYVDDSAITGKVKQIDVTTYKNVVQPSGFVDSPRIRKPSERRRFGADDLIVK